MVEIQTKTLLFSFSLDLIEVRKDSKPIFLIPTTIAIETGRCNPDVISSPDVSKDQYITSS